LTSEASREDQRPSTGEGLSRPRFISFAASAVSVSSASFVLAFVRQLLIADYFGASRGLDIYFIAYAVANWVGFALATSLDSIAVIHFVRAREGNGAASYLKLAGAALRASACMGLIVAATTVGTAYLLAPIVATGFSPQERTALVRLMWWFVPWICLLLPYYVMAARYKGEWRFHRVFVAEILVGIASIAWLVANHGSIRQIPMAYAAGYTAALLWLLPGSRTVMALGRTSLRPLLRDTGALYLTNQVGNIPGIVDRHFQSFVAAGGIAAIGYASQLLMGVSSLIGMRDIFIVPLSEAKDRDRRLERLVIGMLLLSTPAAGVIASFAPEIVRILFERGRFNAEAADITASVLRILALNLVVGAVTTPLARVLQIVRRIRLIHIYYLTVTIFLIPAGFVLVEHLHLGAEGIAWMNLAGSVPASGVLAYLVARSGVVLRWRYIGRFLALATAVTAAAAVPSLAAAAAFVDPLPRLLVGGGSYASIVAACYGVAWIKLNHVVPPRSANIR